MHFIILKIYTGGGCLHNVSGFLELINNMLTTGMVPALFADDEKEAIVGNCRSEAQANGVPPVKEMIWQYFVTKCSNNLHIVLAMSPVGDTLRTR